MSITKIKFLDWNSFVALSVITLLLIWPVFPALGIGILLGHDLTQILNLVLVFEGIWVAVIFGVFILGWLDKKRIAY